METPPSIFTEPEAFTSAPVEVGTDDNTMTVHATDHHWISVHRDGAEIVRESSGEPATTFIVESGEYDVRTDGHVTSVDTDHRDLPTPAYRQRSASAMAPATLMLEAEAPSRHPVDDMPQVPADGTSTCTVTVRKLAEGKHNDEIFLRTTGGTLTGARGKDRVTSVRLRSGTATFRLVSEQAPRQVTVYAFTATAGLSAQLEVEFV